MFFIKEVTNSSRDCLGELLANKVAAMRLKGFLGVEQVSNIKNRIQQLGLETYVGDTKAGTEVVKGKIGPNLFRFKDDLPEYFSRLTEFEEHSRPVLFKEVDVPQIFKSFMKNALPRGSSFQRAHSRSYDSFLSECTVRSLPAAPPHNDWIAGELAGFDAVEELIDQFAWNIYISTGTEGGNLIIYDTTSRSEISNSPGKSVSIQPDPGDLILFRSRNYHEILNTSGDRYTVSGFWGPRRDNNFQYWV